MNKTPPIVKERPRKFRKYLILAGLFEPMTAIRTNAFNPKNDANLLLSLAVSTKRKIKTIAYISPYIYN